MKALSLPMFVCVVCLGVFFSFERAEARRCHSIWAEARGSESHYRHFVYVENDCNEWLQCSVWTDVNPQPPKMLSVAPGTVESAETNGHSPYDDPRGFGSCRLK